MINRLAYYQGLIVAACLGITLIPSSVLADQAGQRRQVTVYRDILGVPHICADTEAAGAYGLGYAQAEDRLGDICQAVRTGMGSMSEAFGPAHIQQDYAMRLWRNAKLAEQRWDELPEHLRSLATAFVQGIQAYESLGRNHLNEQNLMFADTSGNIGYLRNGATPIRPEGYNWKAPVPGHTSKTAWQGLHPAKDLVHIINPERGYMQNCNISPKNMMVDSPLTPDKYPSHIYNATWDQNNPRGRRTIELLEADDSVTTEEAMAYAMDVHDLLAQRWQDELRAAVEANPSSDAQFNAGVNAILDWDGQFLAESTVTSLYKFWRLKCGQQIDVSPIGRDESLDTESRKKLIDLLAATIAELKEKHGKWDITWGDVHKVGRSGQLFPVGGADFRSGDREANFSETLFDVRSSEDPDQPGQYIADNGSMAMLLMFFHRDGIRSYSCIPWGQTTDPESPHHTDQGEKLYSKRKMKPTWWTKEELMSNVESTTTLTIPTP